MSQLIEEISRWVICPRCCHTGVIFTCCPDTIECDHDDPMAPCPDCHGTGWLDLDEIA
jgi:hypothetical protein